MDTEYRICPVCDKVKVLNADNFWRDAKRDPPFWAKCKVCAMAEQRQAAKRTSDAVSYGVAETLLALEAVVDAFGLLVKTLKKGGKRDD